MSASVATANDGQQLDLDSLATIVTRNGNLVTALTVVMAGNTYVQTFLYNGNLVIGWTNWIKQ